MNAVTYRVGVLALFGAGALSSGCATTVNKPRIADAVPPGPARQITVSFAPLFEGRLNSNSVYAGKEPGLMRRVLLSPNLVFESSRSSVDEPKTIGPVTKPGDRSPHLADALGEPVDIQLSSMLMGYLSAPPRNSILLAPALTKKWDPAFWCIGTKDCVEASWVERLILMQMKAPTKDGKEGPAADSKSEDLPTAAFAVRSLGTHLVTTRVVASYTANNELEFRPRRSDAETSVCAEASLTFPIVQFQAELVSLRDGRLLARIDETRSPQLSAETRRQIYATQWIPSRNKAYESYSQEYSGARMIPLPESEYSYIEHYTEQRVECSNALSAYAAVLEDIKRKFEGFTASTAMELFKATIDPLYVTQVTIAPPPSMPAAVVTPPEPVLTPPPVPTAAPLKPAEPQTNPVTCNRDSECKGGRCRNHVCVSR